MGKQYIFNDDECIYWRAYPQTNPRTRRFITSRSKNAVLPQLDKQCNENKEAESKRAEYEKASAVFEGFAPDVKAKLCTGVTMPVPPKQPPPNARRPRRKQAPLPTQPTNAREAFVNGALDTFSTLFTEVLVDNEHLEVEFRVNIDIARTVEQGRMAPMLDVFDELLKTKAQRNTNAGVATMIRNASVNELYLSLIVSLRTVSITVTTTSSLLGPLMERKNVVKLFEFTTTEDDQGAQQAATAYVQFMDLSKLPIITESGVDISIENGSEAERADVLAILNKLIA